MKSYFAMALLSLLLLPVQAQMTQNPHTMSIYRENDADAPAIDWSAGLKSVQPGELARRENPAPYRSELLESMVEWARCVDAQDDDAAAAARDEVLKQLKARPEQVNDVGVMAGKTPWVCSPYAMSRYLLDREMTAELMKQGALPYLPVLTLCVPGRRFVSALSAVRLSRHAKRRDCANPFPNGTALGEMELYLRARAAGVNIRTDAAPPLPPKPEPSGAERMPLPMQKAPFTSPLRYCFTPGDFAQRESDEVYHSELIKAFIIVMNESHSPESLARLEREIRERPEQVNDTYEYCGECSGDSPYAPVQMCLWRRDNAEILELLLAHGALPFAASDWVIIPGAQIEIVQRIIQERSHYLSPLEVALQAQARGVQVLDQESLAEKRKHFTTAYKGDPFYEVPQGKRRPASSSQP